MRPVVDEARKLLYVTAIIDATHIRGTWKGQQYEVRCLPENGAAVGDTIMAHVLPGNTELVAIFRMGEVLYFAPGVEPANYRGELYKYTGTGLPSFVWQAPSDYEWITCMAYYAATSLLYIWTYNDDDGNTRIYKLDPADDSVTWILTWAAPDVPTDVAEHTYMGATYLYVAHGWFWFSPFVDRFDPITETRVTVFTPPAGYLTGICVRNNILYFHTNRLVYSSADGVIWALNADLGLLFGLHVDSPGIMVLNPVDNMIYMTARRALIAPTMGVVLMYDGFAWAVDYDYDPSPISQSGMMGIGMLYHDDTETVVMPYSWWFANERTEAHRKDVIGGWAMDWAGAPLGLGWGSPACQTMATIAKKQCYLVQDYVGPHPNFNVALWVRDAVAPFATNLIQTYAGYQGFPGHADIVSMTIAKTTKKIHEI